MKDIRNLKIAYIGGGSRGWARNLINDLAKEPLLAGEVALYDIDLEGARMNEKIGNDLSAREDIVGIWNYKVYEKIDDALTGADFVVISILPGTFDEMESDVHTPEKYGIYQPVGDSTGPGGIVRALRCLPMFEEFAIAIKNNCPNAWVINFTNPMTMCVRTLYKVFPEIKAFGCCHEVFGTQKLLAKVLKDTYDLDVPREDIIVNIVGVNHFTFLTEAKYKGMDLFPIYKKYVDEHPEGIGEPIDSDHWANAPFVCTHKVKFDLFKRYGAIAAAGDRHLVEFCPGKWYLKDIDTIRSFGFTLTSVQWRKNDLVNRKKVTLDNYNGKPFELRETGEETVLQIKALLGLGNIVTNVNIPNKGQIENLPIDAVVETNAFFSGDSLKPVHAGKVEPALNALFERIVEEQETVCDAALTGDYEKAFVAFVNNPNVCLGFEDARNLFNEMLENTKKYLPHYDRYLKQLK